MSATRMEETIPTDAPTITYTEKELEALAHHVRQNGGKIVLNTIRRVALGREMAKNPEWKATFYRNAPGQFMLEVLPEDQEPDEPVDHGTLIINDAAMALCNTSYGRCPPEGYACVCLRDGRTPDKAIPRCKIVLEAVETVAPILASLGSPIASG